MNTKNSKLFMTLAMVMILLLSLLVVWLSIVIVRMDTHVSLLEEQMKELQQTMQVQKDKNIDMKERFIDTGVVELPSRETFVKPYIYVLGSSSCGVTREVLDEVATKVPNSKVFFVNVSTEKLTQDFISAVQKSGVSIVNTATHSEAFACLLEKMGVQPSVPVFLIKEGEKNASITAISFFPGMIYKGQQPAWEALSLKGIKMTQKISVMDKTTARMLDDFLRAIVQNADETFVKHYCGR